MPERGSTVEMGALEFYEFLERLTSLEEDNKRLGALVMGIDSRIEKYREELLDEIGKRDGLIGYLKERTYRLEDELERVKKRFIGEV